LRPGHDRGHAPAEEVRQRKGYDDGLKAFPHVFKPFSGVGKLSLWVGAFVCCFKGFSLCANASFEISSAVFSGGCV
jgi:hypothetical protein